MNAVFQSPRFRQLPLAVAAALCGTTLAVWAFLSVDAVLVLVGLLCAINISLVLKQMLIPPVTNSQPAAVQLLLDLSADRELSTLHSSIADSLLNTSTHHDPVFRQLALSRLQSVSCDCRQLGRGIVEFESTESWRVVYEELLRSPGLHLYRSVAYIESPHYWQDGPGEQSTQLNEKLQTNGTITVERTAVVADHLWPEAELFPVDPLHSWLDRQHRYGIAIRLVRESALGSDTDLLTDFGIYGSRAVGMQSADPTGRTIRFVLDFNFAKVQEAEVKWSRLAVYATPYRTLLEKQH